MKKTFIIVAIITSSFLLMGLDSVEVISRGENIVLKALLINPSQTQKKFLPFKAFLPQEVKPENIIEKGDLRVAYDAQQGAYYVFKDMELKPGETITQEILIKDIWNVSSEEINSIRSEVDKITKLTENSDFAERANFLENSIESKLKLISDRQAVPPPTADRHISEFRENQRILEMVKSDLAALKSLLAQMNKPISSTSTWKLILGITVFLGILGLAFFIMWSRQVKGSAEKMEKGKKEPIISGEKREAEQEKKVDIKDIEERLKQ